MYFDIIPPIYACLFPPGFSKAHTESLNAETGITIASFKTKTFNDDYDDKSLTI
jgi:hypothetical protein